MELPIFRFQKQRKRINNWKATLARFTNFENIKITSVQCSYDVLTPN